MLICAALVLYVSVDGCINLWHLNFMDWSWVP